MMQAAGIVFYMLFMQRYLATRSKHPFLYKLYNTGIVLLIESLLGYTYFHYFTDNFNLENWIENISKILLLLMIIIFLVYSLRHWQDKLLRYLFWKISFSWSSEIKVGTPFPPTILFTAIGKKLRKFLSKDKELIVLDCIHLPKSMKNTIPAMLSKYPLPVCVLISYTV